MKILKKGTWLNKPKKIASEKNIGKSKIEKKIVVSVNSIRKFGKFSWEGAVYWSH